MHARRWRPAGRGGRGWRDELCGTEAQPGGGRGLVLPGLPHGRQRPARHARGTAHTAPTWTSGKQDVVAGGRRCGAGCGATRRRGCLSTTTSRAATTTRSTTRATSTAGVRRASPRTQPRRKPIPYDARGRPAVRPRSTRTADGVLFARETLDRGDGECTWLKLVPLLRARPNMIFPVALLSRCRRHVSAGGRR